LGVLGQNDPQTSDVRKALAESALPYAKLRFKAILRELIFIRLTCASAQEKRQ